MAKKNRSCLSIAVLLTTLIGVTKQLQIFLFSFTTAILKIGGGACNKPLERYFQYLFSGILKGPKFLKLQLINQKKQICSRLTSADQDGQKNRNGQMIAVFFYHVLY
jgi:hypothetical protein